jgi:hypothetical protein
MSYNHNNVRFVYKVCPKCSSCEFFPEWDSGSAPDEIVLTQELVNCLRTNGSFTSATIKALGLPGIPVKGWAQALVGTRMPRAIYEKALAGVGKYSKYTLKMNKQND